MSAKTFSFPLYEARTVEKGTVIAGPSTDCLRMNNAARSFERFGGVQCQTVWVGTLSAAKPFASTVTIQVVCDESR